MCKKNIRVIFFFSSRRRHTRYWRDWSSDVVLFRSWNDAAQAEGRPITLVLQVDGDTTVRASRAGLRDALMNLVMNADDAMPNGGAIRLRAQRADARVPATEDHSRDRYTPASRDRAFQPFYS